jgi:predicted Mrr-cat superfamily restriction endonuclease
VGLVTGPPVESAGRGEDAARDEAVWLARTGEGGYALAKCMAANVVALRYRTVVDARTLSDAEIEASIARAGTRVSLGTLRAMLERFVYEVEAGDVVVTPHARTRQVFFATVTGDYRYENPSPVFDFLHLRTVEWFGKLDRDTDLTDERRRQIDRQPTFYELPDQPWWRERARLVRTESAQLVLPENGPGLRLRTPRQAGAPTIATVQCKECFLAKPAAMMAGGICGDCR